ncbi:MAG TPA: hypothetical protein ENN81_03685 [Phycisphaerales bacterium]|nr:hypothetical protein [Phycisphaerales bacterium]
MQTNARWTPIAVTSLLLAAFAGCNESRTVGPAPRTDVNPQTAVVSHNARFQEAEPTGKTAVESAVELSREHARLAEEMVALRELNRQLQTENTDLSGKLAESQDQLQKTRQELNEANDLLIEMRTELNNWKNDVIGFRDEMRDAERTQLEALLKILTILGGEVRPQTAASTDLTLP